MHLRPARPSDVPGIHRVNVAAFGTPAEADLVDALRRQARPIVSLVAAEDDEVIGHILFSPVTLSPPVETLLMGLAPLAVLPGWQRQGVGSALVRAGLDECRQLGVGAVFVLGHADYYPRFGYVPASRFGVKSEYDVPDEVFMALELSAGTLRHCAGTVRYHPAFAAV